MPTTSQEDGFLYISDYITNAADWDDQELSGKTAGSDYCYLPAVINLNEPATQEAEVVYYPGGEGFFFKYDQDAHKIMIRSDKLSVAEYGYLKQYWKKHRDNGSDPDYLNFRKAASTYYPFYDKSGSAVEYARGFWHNRPQAGWRNDRPEVYYLAIDFKVVWT